MIRCAACSLAVVFAFTACATSKNVDSTATDAQAPKDASASSEGGFAADTGAAPEDSGASDASTEDANEAGSCTMTGDPTCVACIQKHCCAELAACQSEPDCVAIDTCENNCGHTTTCNNNCMNAHPTGQPLAQAFVDCVTNQCAVDCPQ